MNDKLKVGDPVVVKAGTKDPDTGQDMSGWQGRVVSFHSYEGQQTVLLHWDSITLENMPPAVIEQCEEEGLSWAEFGVYVTEVEPAQARDTGRQVKEAVKRVESQYGWLGIGPEGKAIQKVVAGIDLDDYWTAFEAWHRHLSANLKLPFEAKVDEWQERGPLRAGDKLKVLDINEHIGDLYGVLVDVKGKRGLFAFPLCDLAALDEKSDNYALIQEYRVWFANR
jgi:hypothetical protein